MTPVNIFYVLFCHHLQIDVEIINDNQWEPDEEFFLKISLLMDQERREGVQLGRISIMEITILNDDGESLGQVETGAGKTVVL